MITKNALLKVLESNAQMILFVLPQVWEHVTKHINA